MCDFIGKAQELSRRQLLQRAGTAAAATVAVGAAGPANALASARHAPQRRHGNHSDGGASRHRTRLVLLGVMGGPVWNSDQHGVSSALVVEDAVYVIDFGDGTWSQYRRAFARDLPEAQTLASLRAAFLTHMHSDHIVDYNNLLIFGGPNGLNPRAASPIHVYGPGDRGSLPPVYPPGRPAPPVFAPDNPTPGIADTTAQLFHAFASDINDRLRNQVWPDPSTRVLAHDIPLPAGAIANANTDSAPAIDPILVYEDDRVKVTATLVNHQPTFPSFGFRFDSEDGSVVFSGDTAPEPNLVKLAEGADVLVHEAIDPRWVESLFPDPHEPEAEAVIHHLLSSHTTIEQLGPLAEEAEVETLVLNHFSPETSYRRWRESKRGFSGRVIVGEDLLRLGVGRRSHRGRR